MKIFFKDVSKGVVDARVIVELENGIFINEITILRKQNRFSVEFPEKTFRGKDNKIHNINIITFENDDKKTLWEIDILEKHKKWRETNRRVYIL